MIQLNSLSPWIVNDALVSIIGTFRTRRDDWFKSAKRSITDVELAMSGHAGAKSPGKDKESNWLPAPNGTFSLYMRAYWADQAILDGTWQPPIVAIVK